ncbi:tetratricopeptide repeat protein [Prochlorococcus sp. MIT 0801]|uniref:tetratricopeptide repeat protein n=1 Tax=Prochlorococcus sp. MIT 0801 TaxID=1501269 RepID=UPI0004F7E0E7|nr:tetratricopeptide repeat protein [Prochlorococcus sp. MIT 0801]AIQ96141.1 Translation elongation factor P [Prochlorococcus sp. MIT 0801]
MEESGPIKEVKKKVTEITTFPVPFSLGEIKENISISTNTPSKPSKEQIINQAFKFHSQGNISEAEKYYQYFINEGFSHHKVFCNYGVILKTLGKLQEAELSFRKAIEINPEYRDAYVNLGDILKNVGKLQEAELSTRKAIEINPNCAMAHSNLGVILKDLGKLQEAEISYRKAIEINPDFAEAHSNLGNILKDLGKLQEAELSFRKAIEINPDFAEAHYNLGTISRDLGKLQEAELSFRKAIEINPDFAEAHYNLGTISRDLCKFQEAEISYRKAIEINPDFAEAHSNLGNILKDLGKLQEAESSFRKAIQLKPDFAMAHLNMGNILNNIGKLQEAEISYRKAIEINPDYAEAHSNLGIILSDLGKLQEAELSFRKAIQLKPDFAEAAWNLYGLANTIEEAEERINQCLKIDENHLEAKLSLSGLKLHQGYQSLFDNLIQSIYKDHPTIRSLKWVSTLPKLPELFFHRWALFDSMINKSKTDRPFYEFGVWRGESFQYLINTFKKGYGFDTFQGLPEDWHEEKQGFYSADGVIPNIDGGTFIAGKFEETLPTFYSKPRPIASLINFDADLYSSTICALNYSKSVIDKDTILIFDEFIINKNWEQDEYKALNEFCSNNNLSYEVLAISYMTKQVAVKLIGI